MTTINNNPIVTAPVLIPYAPDCEYKYGEEILAPEKIQQLATSFNDYKIIDLQHEYTKRLMNNQKPIQRGNLLKSYISTDELYLRGLDGYNRKYPKGTWIITVEITDPLAMKLYNEGLLTGFSVTVKQKEHADTILEYVGQKSYSELPPQIIQSEKDFTKTPKRILMKDVKNPVAFTVSLVKQPCVYGAKFCRKTCIINNQNKLKENNDIVSLKEKIKAELNNFIDGLDVEEESIKADNETEQEQEQGEVQVSEDTGAESVKSAETEETESTKTETESEKAEDPIIECEKCGQKHPQSQKCGGKPKESTKETPQIIEEEDEEKTEVDIIEENESTKTETETESEKEVLYLAQDDVTDLIKTTLQRYAEEIEAMVFDGIQEALDDYYFADSMKSQPSETETVESEKGEVEDVETTDESVKSDVEQDYATPEMVESIFDEQFQSFKSEIMSNIKKAQSESIKSYSKAITPLEDGLSTESKQEYKPSMSNRDVYGRKIRRR